MIFYLLTDRYWQNKFVYKNSNTSSTKNENFYEIVNTKNPASALDCELPVGTRLSAVNVFED